MFGKLMAIVLTGFVFIGVAGSVEPVKTNKAKETIAVNGTVMTIHADPAGDTVLITQVGNVLTVNGQVFDASTIQLIKFLGSPHDDVCDATGVNIRTVMHGEAGNDILKGGKQSDRLYGGTGNDELYGNEMNDFLDGWKGVDEFHGGTGTDTSYDFPGEAASYDSVEYKRSY